ncbi:uncharacterized protein SRS1_13501 [Sporisorium reilianum f. sp. reilianum]|uniref:Uncharacterized protein n=1 Tax=Sporisorium reilianum f. sp. reilianum TaxID=72559 RepID=A0A2N8UMQ9_9BASI|nr:uncharacterized protein SRS1_13501 [Sporisorium reilianum f. sp. reilianum]
MDGDRASAARKLPQTAANFFVGTRSRVPRLTLAQSSHIIPIPLTPSPGLKPSSHAVFNRLRSSPFLPSSPTSTKAPSSPREVLNKGSKVAKAVHLFSALTDQAGPSPPEQLNAAPTLPRIESAPSDSPLAPSPSTSTATAPTSTVSIAPQSLSSSVTSASSALILCPSKMESEPQSFELDAMPRTPSTQLSASAELRPARQALQSPRASPSRASAHLVIAASDQLTVSHLAEICTVPTPASASMHDPADSDPFSLSMALSTSQDDLQNHVDEEVALPHPASPSSAQCSKRQRHSLFTAPPMPLLAPAQHNPRTLAPPDSASTHDSKSEACIAEDPFECLETIFDAELPLPTFKEAVFSEPVPPRSTSKHQSSPKTASGLFPRELIDAALAPTSAFSDTTVPSTSSAHRQLGTKHASTGSSQRQSDTLGRGFRSWDSPIPISSKYASSPLAMRLSTVASPLDSTRSFSQSSPGGTINEVRSNPASLASPHDLPDQHIRLCLEGEAPSTRQLTAPGYPSESISTKAGVDPEQANFREGPSSIGSKVVSSLSPDHQSNDHVSATLKKRQDPRSSSPAHEDRQSASLGTVDEAFPEDNFIIQSDLSRRDSVELRQKELQDSFLAPPSAVDDEVLLDLIDMAAMPIAVAQEVNLQDSLFERTASWIKSTSDEHEPVMTEPSSFEQDNVDRASIATHLQSEMESGADASTRKETSPIAQSSLAYITDDSQSRFRAQSDQTAARKQQDVSVRKIGATSCSIVDAVRSLENRSSQYKAAPNLNAGPISQKITRSYSQRAHQGQHTPKGTKRIPGRLKIPQRLPESPTPSRRDSLELLSVRRAQLSSAKEKGTSPHTVTREKSYEGIGSAQAGKFNDVLRSWSRNADPEASQATARSQGKHRITRLVKDWDDGQGSSDDDEVAAVSTCQRMTLRRMSDFTVLNTPRRDPRPLPGKLLRADRNASPTRPPPSLVRPLMRLQHGLQSSQEVTTTAPVGRLIHKSQSHEKEPKRASSPPRRRLRHLDSYTTISKGSKSTSRGLRMMAAHDVRASRIEPRLSSSEADSDEPQEILRARDKVGSGLVARQFQAAPTICMQSVAPTSQHAPSTSMRPLKLQESHPAFSTPRRRDGSVTTTPPLTVVSELWTPDASNPAKSVLTEATSVATASGLRPLLTARNRARSQTVSVQNAQRTANCMRPDVSADSPTRIRSRSRSQSNRHASEVESGMRRSVSHPMPASQTFLDVRQLRADSRTSAHLSGACEHSNLDSERGTTVPERSPGVSTPSFEISFEVTEPKMAPHVQEGTLMEFGVRVLFKPSGAEHRSRSPSPYTVSTRLDTSERTSKSIPPMQYEYDSLSKHDMSKVQQQAQEHLSRTLASPDQRKLRLDLQERYLLSPFSDHREPDRSSTLTESGSLTSSNRVVRREIKLTRERHPSPSTAPSSVLSTARGVSSVGRTSSASLASPIPYIKRAPPRTATFSSVTTQS